jgi:hypothetical protein
MVSTAHQEGGTRGQETVERRTNLWQERMVSGNEYDIHSFFSFYIGYGLCVDMQYGRGHGLEVGFDCALMSWVKCDMNRQDQPAINDNLIDIDN